MEVLEEVKVSNIWFPFTQMQGCREPIKIVKGDGTYLIDENGKKYIDAISSWWVNLHGHSHPHIAKRIAEQAATLEHVIFSDFVHEPALELSERLLKYLPQNQSKLFYSDNGSTSVEVALKLAIQYWYNKDQEKKKIVALKGAYHGDTMGGMSAADRTEFNKPFWPFLFDVEHIDVPVLGKEQEAIQQLKEFVRNKDVAAFIYEPLVQGAAGMVMYSPEVLNELMNICKEHEVLTIADEVMTGFYRTGKFFASNHMDVDPDMMCMSKGLTGGAMAMSITSCSQKIYDAFLNDDSSKNKTFFHGHSFTANPIACAASLASLDLIEEEACLEAIKRIEAHHKIFIEKLKDYDKAVNIRQLGTIIAFDVKTDLGTSYFNELRSRYYDYFLNKGVLLRPLGNVIYILPPYCINTEDLNYIYDTILSALEEL